MASTRTMIYEFVSEAKEHLANVADDLLALEKHGGETARYRIDRVFRAVHSVKGGAGFFGCRKIEDLAHVMETLLDFMRRERVQSEPAAIDALLAGADRILALLDDVERSNEADVAEVYARLQGFLPDEPPASEKGRTPAPSAPPPREAASETMAAPLQERPAGHGYLYKLRIDLEEHFRLQGQSPVRLLKELRSLGAVLDARVEVADDDLGAGLPTGAVVYEALYSSALGPEQLQEAAGLAEYQVVPIEVPDEAPPAAVSTALPEPEPGARSPERGPRTSSETIRINVHLLDRLMTLAGELVLVRNQTLQTVEPDDMRLRPIVQRLNGVTSELQETVMLTRMQPVGNLFGKFPRLVRDLSKQLGKDIELTVGGKEVELDKTILEALSDPLTHLVRNCCDHGIETPENRAAAGKPGVGRVLLQAHHEGGQIRIEVRDDGKGIDPEALKRKAQESGLKTAAELARMTDMEALGLILMPGFSTAAAVTDLSGRGVGMDVVKTNIEQLGGNLDIESTPGKGTVFHLRLPLTLAIIPCLIVRVGGERFAIPQKDLEELVGLEWPSLRDRVECAYDQEVYRLRGRLLPLVRLAEILARPQPFTAATRAEIIRKHRPTNGRAGGVSPLLTTSLRETAPGPMLNFAVLKVGAERFGLIVDDILNTEEVVVKPMHGSLKALRCFSGATIMGDGRVALILDIERIARHAGVFADVVPEPVAPIPGDGLEKEAQTSLLFTYGEQEQYAMALPMIRRIEMIRTEQIERVGDREFITLEGVPTSVLRLDRYLSVSSCPDRETMFLLLPKNLPRPVGVLMTSIIDTETAAIELNTESYRADGVLGSAVVRDRMTLFLDIYRLADKVDPSWLADRRRQSPPPEGKRRILLVEDTKFFEQLVKGYLEADGYDVTVAGHGAAALEVLEREDFDLVVSDIEMPVMTGWEFAKAVRKQGRHDLPLLALTTLTSDRDREKARECGFDRYEVKIDRERFLTTVADLLREKQAAKEPRRQGE